VVSNVPIIVVGLLETLDDEDELFAEVVEVLDVLTETEEVACNGDTVTERVVTGVVEPEATVPEDRDTEIDE